MSKYIKLKYFFLFLICIWNPFQLFILKMDGAQRTIGTLIMITIIANIGNTNFIKTAFRNPVLVWGIWVIYAFINTITIYYNFDLPYYSFLTILFAPFFVVWVITSEEFEDKDIIFNIIIIGIYIRIILIFLFDSSRTADLNRFGLKLDSNEIAISAVVLIVFLYLKYLYKRYTLKILILLILFPLFMIFATASRNGFGAFIILLFSHFYIHRSGKTLSGLIMLMFGIIFVVSTLYFVSEKTYLGKRLSETTQQGSMSDYNLNGTIFEKFGDRGIFYVLGFELFKSHPVRGIGFGNTSLYQSHGLVMHSEIMIQLAELGLIGFFLFLLYYGWIGKNLLACRKKDIDNRKITEGYLAGLIIILIMGLTVFQNTNPMFFLLSGSMIAHVFSVKRNQQASMNN